MANFLAKSSKFSPSLNGLYPGNLGNLSPNSFGVLFTRGTKHWNPKFRKLRSLKMIKVKLPDVDSAKKSIDEFSREEIKSRMKERGILPSRHWVDKPMYISSTGGVFEPYIPPEGDGKVSVITTQGAKQKIEFIEKKGKSMLAARKIRNFEEDFEFSEFLNEAQEVYINVHKAMISKDRDKLIQYVTERAYPEVVNNIGDKTMHWEFIQSIEPPRVVHVRCTEVIFKENIFAQITARFHTQQKLTIYDRFGRLLHGSETLPKDVLEYVVFEKHISNKYGRWRVHDKIIPNWMPPKAPQARTQILPEEEPEPEPDTAVAVEKSSVAPETLSSSSAAQPATA